VLEYGLDWLGVWGQYILKQKTAVEIIELEMTELEMNDCNYSRESL